MKKVISFAIVLAIIVSTCCVSAFAEIDYTNTYHMSGNEIKGNTVMNSYLISTSTYCENINFGKAAHVTYYYYFNHDLYNLSRGSEDTFVTNGFDSYSVTYAYTTTTKEYVGGLGRHRVKAASYLIWSSHACEDDSCVGAAIPDYSDV